MNETLWTWADLDAAQAELVQETEQELGADVVLVYQPTTSRAVSGPAEFDPDLRPVELEDAQLESLRSLERAVGAVAVAYRRG